MAVKNKPDVILLDIMMPQMDGFKVLELLKKKSKTVNIPVVMVSARGEDSYKHKAAALYDEDYILSGKAENLLNPRYIDRRILGERFINLDELRSEDEEGEIKKGKEFVKLKALSKKEYASTVNKITQEVIADWVYSNYYWGGNQEIKKSKNQKIN